MKPATYSSSSDRATGSANDHLNGATLIDAEGREIAITEDMIRQCLDSFEDHWMDCYKH